MRWAGDPTRLPASCHPACRRRSGRRVWVVSLLEVKKEKFSLPTVLCLQGGERLVIWSFSIGWTEPVGSFTQRHLLSLLRRWGGWCRGRGRGCPDPGGALVGAAAPAGTSLTALRAGPWARVTWPAGGHTSWGAPARCRPPPPTGAGRGGPLEGSGDVGLLVPLVPGVGTQGGPPTTCLEQRLLPE